MENRLGKLLLIACLLVGAFAFAGDSEPTLKTKVTGGDELFTADVFLDNGKNRMSVQASQAGTWNINNVSGTVSLPTGAATSANQSTQITSLQLIDDIVHANDDVLNKGVPMQAQLDDVSTGTVTEDHVSTLRMTPSRGLHVNLRDASGNQMFGIKTAANSIPVVIASDQPTLGNGSLVDSNLAWSTSIDVNMASGGVDNGLVLFKNPAGSGKKIYLWRIVIGCTVVNVATEFTLYYDPTVSANGTTMTPRLRNIGNTATSIANVYSLPTVTSFGTMIDQVSNGQNNNSQQFAHDFSIVIQPNHSVLVSGNPTSNNRNALVTIVWVEQSL